MTINWQLVVFEFLNFVVLMALLNRFLFQPIRRVLAKRREEIERHDQETGVAQAQAEELQEEYREKLATIESENERERSRIRAEAVASAANLVERARSDMQRAQERHRADLEVARVRSLDALKGEVSDLAVQAAGRVIEGMSETSIAEAYARRGARRLLEAGALPEGVKVSLCMSPDGDPERVQQAVVDVVKDRCRIEAEVDPDVVGGVRFVYRDLEIEASAGASLRRWLDEMTEPPRVPVKGDQS